MTLNTFTSVLPTEIHLYALHAKVFTELYGIFLNVHIKFVYRNLRFLNIKEGRTMKYIVIKCSPCIFSPLYMEIDKIFMILTRDNIFKVKRHFKGGLRLSHKGQMNAKKFRIVIGLS